MYFRPKLICSCLIRSCKIHLKRTFWTLIVILFTLTTIANFNTIKNSEESLPLEDSKKLPRFIDTINIFVPEQTLQLQPEGDFKKLSRFIETTKNILSVETPQSQVKNDSKKLSHFTYTLNNSLPKETLQPKLKDESKNLSHFTDTAENFLPEETLQSQFKNDSKKLSHFTDTTKNFLPEETLRSSDLIPQDGVWQPVVGASHKLYVFSAYYDARPDQMSKYQPYYMRKSGVNFTKHFEQFFCTHFLTLIVTNMIISRP